MMIDAAMLGVGVGLARASLVADHIADGRLVCPLDLASPAAYSYYLLGLPDVAERRRTAALRKLLVAEARATETSMLSLGAAPAVRAMHA